MTTSIEFRRPGVEVQEAVLPRDTGGVNTGRARSVIAGKFRRGPEGPFVVNSWLQFQNVYGSWVADPDHDFAVDAVYSYFSNAGSSASQLTVLRLLGDGAEKSAGVVGGISFEAISAGTWGDGISVQVFVPTEDDGGQFRAAEFQDAFDTRADTPLNTVQVRVQLGEGTPEVYTNLSLDPLSRFYVKSIINTQSSLVRVTDAPDAASSEGPENLTGGEDGDAAAADVAAQLELLDSIPTPILLYVAAQKDFDADPTEQAKGLAYVKGSAGSSRGDSFCVLDVERNEGVKDVAMVTAPGDTSAFGAAYWPWIQVIDPLRAPTNVRKLVAPGGSVLGAIADVDARIGPWRTPAGTSVVLRNAVDVDRRLTDSELKDLNSRSRPINAIRPVSGSGVCIMGGRTLDQTNADRYVGVRRSLNYITANLKVIAEGGLFEPNGPDLWERLTTQMNDWLGRYYQQGALRGAREPEAFRVTINDSNNTPSTIAAGELHIEIGVAVEFPAEFVIIRLVQYQTSVRN